MKKSGNLKALKRLTVYFCNEEGHGDTRPQTIYIDPSGDTSLVMKIPEYVVSALGCEDQVRHSNASELTRKFEAKMREYLDWYQNKKAEPVIILHTKYMVFDRCDRKDDDERDRWHDRDEGNMFFFSDLSAREAQLAVGLSVSYMLAYRINGAIHYRVKNRQTGEFGPGHRVAHVHGNVLDYTPQLHAKIDRICEALFNAVETIEEIVKSKDVAKALLTSASVKRLTKS